jgi:Flp pilus assembly protein TadG
MRDCRGSLTIEFAILFPVLFLLLVGGIELGMVVVERMQLEFATEAAAKCFATSSSNPNPNPNLPCVSIPATAAYAAGLLAPVWGISASNFSVTKTPSGEGCVTSSYTYTPMILPSIIPLGASACYPIS